MLTIITGRMGTGKSTLMAKLVKQEFDSGKKVYSNTPFTFKSEFINERKLIKLCEKSISNVCIVLDNSYLYLDSRCTQTKVNRLFSYMVNQRRRMNNSFYIVTNDVTNIDKRLRDGCDRMINCIEYDRNTNEVHAVWTIPEKRNIDISSSFNLLKPFSLIKT